MTHGHVKRALPLGVLGAAVALHYSEQGARRAAKKDSLKLAFVTSAAAPVEKPGPTSMEGDFNPVPKVSVAAMTTAKPTSALALPLCLVSAGAAYVAIKSQKAHSSRGAARTHRVTRHSARPQTEPRAMSQAIPFLPVPAHLTNNPTNTAFPGDVGFDPLGIAADNYFDEVISNFGITTFDSMRWYREAELMHGRVAMLATFNFILRESLPTGIMPERILEQGALLEFVQVMTMLEAFRGYRLFFNQEQIAGDLGLGAGPVVGGWKVRWDMTLQELADKQYKELQNGRLAMLAFLGMTAQFSLTGHAIGIDWTEVNLWGDTFLQNSTAPWALTAVGTAAAVDGVRRLSSEASSPSSSIAAKALNPLRLAFGVQDPPVPLPPGVVAGQLGQRYELSQEQIAQFKEDGVIHIKGAFKDWVDFLREVTTYQIEHPHVWSLVGRMSGLYDYIQRNCWMTNNGFRDFLYYSALGHIAAQLGETTEIRATTDLLLVNPNKGFGWHQDNQNGPIDFPHALRWWTAMDRCGQDDYGAPEYLLGSHLNKSVSGDAVFVNLQEGDLPEYKKTLKLVPEPGDLIIWDARTIHRIVAPPNQRWDEGTQRRALGGTLAKANTPYYNKGGASGISDLAGHKLVNGDALGGAYFPRLYPERVPEEEAVRARGGIIGRSPLKIAQLGITLASNASKYMSFSKVVGKRD